MSRRFCFALDLKSDAVLTAEYRNYHEKIRPEITQSLKDFGLEDLEIYLLGMRMFMIMERLHFRRLPIGLEFAQSQLSIGCVQQFDSSSNEFNTQEVANDAR